MALAIDITEGHGLSDEAHRKEEQSNAVFAVHFTVKAFNQLHITDNMKHFSFKSGRAVRVAKLTKTDWLVVLQ